MTGLYLSSRRAETTILSVVSAFDQLKVSANSDGTISVDALKNYSGQAKHLREVGPLVFRDVNGSDYVAFMRDASGHLELALDFPVFIFQRVPWYKGTYLNQGVFYGSLGVFGLALLFWPLGAGRHPLALREKAQPKPAGAEDETLDPARLPDQSRLSPGLGCLRELRREGSQALI